MGALDFCFLWLFPAWQQRGEGRGPVRRRLPALSSQKCLVPFGEGGRGVEVWAVGRHRAGQEGTGITSLSSLLNACREAHQPEVSLCGFRPIFTVSE